MSNLAEVAERLENEFGFKLLKSASKSFPYVVFQKKRNWR